MGLLWSIVAIPLASALVLAVLGSWTVGQRMLRAWRSREIA